MMYGIIAILSSLLFLAVVSSKRTNTNDVQNFTMFSMDDFLRQYPTEPWGNWGGPHFVTEIIKTNWPPQEHGTVTELLDFNGKIRKKFAFETISTDKRVSVICSPFSAMMPLGMLMIGANDASVTEKELLKAVGESDKKKAGHHFKKLRTKMKNLSGPTTHLASRIYINKDKSIRSSFKSNAENIFDSCIESLNMKEETKAAKEVNDWVKHHTKDKITDILKATDISPSTVILIVDALYFAGYWEHIFNRARPQKFYGANGETTVNMMSKERHYTYGSSNALGAEAILIPYKGGSASMLVLLPHNRNGLHLLLSQLKIAPDLINQIKMRDVLVELKLPKFKIESTLNLKILYEKVGLKEIFRSGMDHMVKHGNVLIDQAVHKAIIEVDELGTVAAASSMTHGVGATRPVDRVSFIADHPFLFFIIAHKQQLFAGTFVG